MRRVLVGTTEQEVAAGEELSLTRTKKWSICCGISTDTLLAGEARPSGRRFRWSSPSIERRRFAWTPKKLARDHKVELDSQSGLVSILGGKWTTYRAMAQDTIDVVQKSLGGNPTPCSTSNHSLVGSDGYSADYWKTLISNFGVLGTQCATLAEKYGTRATHLLAPHRR